MSGGPEAAAEAFVWWRCTLAASAEAAQAVGAWHVRLRASEPGLACTLFRRQERGVLHVTWMEHYRFVPGSDVEATLARIEEQALSVLARIGVPQRHVEWFERLPG